MLKSGLIVDLLRSLMRPSIITGGIGTGKSTVCSRLSKMGVEIIDADAIAHQVLDEKAQKIATLFGADCLDGKKVNRKKLGEIVFDDAQKRKILEDFLHPIIHERILSSWQTCQKNNQDCILDIPLYFESKNRYDDFKIVVVYATKEQQFERLKKRDGLSDSAIQKRLKAQWPIEKKRQNADWIVDNSKDYSTLGVQIESLYRWLKESNAHS